MALLTKSLLDFQNSPSTILSTLNLRLFGTRTINTASLFIRFPRNLSPLCITSIKRLRLYVQLVYTRPWSMCIDALYIRMSEPLSSPLSPSNPRPQLLLPLLSYHHWGYSVPQRGTYTRHPSTSTMISSVFLRDFRVCMTATTAKQITVRQSNAIHRLLSRTMGESAQ